MAFRKRPDIGISRRNFLRHTIALAGGVAAAEVLFGTWIKPYSKAALIPEYAREILTHHIQYRGKSGPVAAYLARPVKAGTYPALVMIHADTGFDRHHREAARRFAAQGYVTLLPDFSSHHRGSENRDPAGCAANDFRTSVPWQCVTEDVEAGIEYLKVFPDVRGARCGLVGFHWGGDMAFAAATRIRGLQAVVIYDGRSPEPLALVRNIHAPVLAHYVASEPSITENVAATAAVMKRYKKAYAYKVYPVPLHGLNDHVQVGCDWVEGAREAWAQTGEFLNQRLKS